MWGVLAAIGGLIAMVGVLTLDLTIGSDTLRGRSLRSATISEYVFTSGAWAFNLAVLALALGSAALVVGLVRTGRLAALSPGSILLALWVLGLLAIAAFPKHNWAVGPSASGSVHRLASMVAFLSIPVAILVIARLKNRRGSAAATAAWWLNLGSVAFIAVLIGAVLYGALGGGSWWQVIPLGLVERGILAFEVASVIALGVWAARAR